MADANLKDVMHYFEMPTTEFSKEWKRMTEQDKKDLKAGIGDGTLTY